MTVRNENTRQFFIHLHIPKCGGSTVVNVLQRNFRKHLYSTNSILNDYQYDSDQVLRIINQHPHLKCLTGHKLSLDLPFSRNKLDIVALAWIRHPIDRFLSHYFYHRLHTDLVPEAKHMDLTEYTEWALKFGHQKMYINGQVEFLAGGSMEKINSLVIERKLLLFPLSKLQQSFYTLQHSYPDVFSDIKIKNKNISKRDQCIPENYQKTILPYVEEDMRLLELSNKALISGNDIPKRIKCSTANYQSIWRNTASCSANFLRKVANYIEPR